MCGSRALRPCDQTYGRPGHDAQLLGHYPRQLCALVCGVRGVRATCLPTKTVGTLQMCKVSLVHCKVPPVHTSFALHK
jgi:hypothetical protein